MSSTIPKGFVLKARKIEDSEIAHASPCTREVFDLMIRKANFRDKACGQTVIRRGQWLTTYEEIQELLHWTVGFRKEFYSRDQIEAAMKWLRSRLMVTTSKTTRGLFVSVVNYELYQNPGNYEHHTENRTEDLNDATLQLKNEKNVRITFGPNSNEFRLGKLLLDLIRRRKPDFKEPDLQSWAKHVDRMLRLDKRDPARVEQVIRWCQADPFWQANILSTEKLREKFDTLEMKMRPVNRPGNDPDPAPVTTRNGLTPREQVLAQKEAH